MKIAKTFTNLRFSLTLNNYSIFLHTHILAIMCHLSEYLQVEYITFLDPSVL